MELHGRILGAIKGAQPGPTVIAMVAVHGNEPAGVTAARRTLDALRALRGGLACGEFIAVVGNLGALQAGQRYLDQDLNRSWTDELMAQLLQGRRLDREANEQLALIQTVNDIKARARGPVHLLDLHTTSSTSPPFVFVNDTPTQRRLASSLPLPVVFRLEAFLKGTMMSWARQMDMDLTVIEGGRHDDPESINRHEVITWLMLEALGCVDASPRPELSAYQGRMRREHAHIPASLEVTHRHPVKDDDQFKMQPGYDNFTPVDAGQLLAEDRRGPVRAHVAGYVLLPLYQKQGSDGFFIARSLSAEAR